MAKTTRNIKADASMRLETEAVIHSLNGKLDTAIILSHVDNNHCLAEYKGEVCTAIWNPFSGYYYVDDVYGKVGKSTTDRQEKEVNTPE